MKNREFTITLKELPEWVKRGVVDLFPEEYDSFEHKLKNSTLRVKFGIDPTGSDIHLGHYTLFRKLRAFQDAGHTAVLIIGDFTARIGDPTGKNSTRIQLTAEQVEDNAKTYLKQLGLGQSKEHSILDFETPGRLDVKYNSVWLSKLDLSFIIELTSRTTVSQLLAKEDFSNRYNKEISISLHEFLYPLLQGYDSVVIQSDIELGGTDQKFNIAIGRDLQRYYGQKSQVGLLMPILPGTDGVHKMSKSIGNIVSIKDPPLDMYSKLEKIPDSAVDNYITLLTDLIPFELSNDPRERQKIMAYTVVSNFYGQEIAKEVKDSAEKIVLNRSTINLKDLPNLSLDEVQFPIKIFHLLSCLNLFPSGSEARRQIKNGGVRLDGEKISDSNLEFYNSKELEGKVLQLGKKTFRKLVVN
jgi:tyrosyl-tRNA synthetase